MRHSDFAYVNDVRAAVELRTPRTARMLLITIGAMLFCALVWANFAILDEVKRGSGRVIPSQQMQVVQSLEGGIVQEILIQEGAIVKKGQPLMRIDDTNFAAQLGEVRERRAAMAARVARLEAEANGAQRPVFEPVLRELAP
jgi:adhesin transport system membrane fusion protein